MNDAPETETANVIPTTYVGVKRIEAWPQVESDAHGKPIENGRDGYAVRYPDGYLSWSPAGAFEEAYRAVPPDRADIAIDTAQTLVAAIAQGVDVNVVVDTAKTNEAVSEASATGPRVSLGDVESKIVAEYSFTHNTALGEDVPLHPRLSVVTVAVLVMENGMVITGTSAPVADSNFNEELGRRFARENALQQAIGFEAYLLRQRLHCQQQATEALDAAPDTSLEQLGTDAWLWAETFVAMLDKQGAFPNEEAKTEFQGIALGWFANAIERARDEGLRRNPAFDPDAKETPNFRAMLAGQLADYGVEDGSIDSVSSVATPLVLEAMGDAYAHGLARTTFPTRQLGEAAPGAELVHQWPRGETTPLYQISGPNLDIIQRTLDAIAEGHPPSPANAAMALKIIAEAIAERDGGIMVGGALVASRSEAATRYEPELSPEAREHVDERRDEVEVLRQGGGLIDAGAIEAAERPISGFVHGQGFTRQEDDADKPKE